MSTFSDISRSSRKTLTYNPRHWSVHNSIQHYNLSSGFIVRKRMKSQAQVLLPIHHLEQMSSSWIFRDYKRPRLQGHDWIGTFFGSRFRHFRCFGATTRGHEIPQHKWSGFWKVEIELTHVFHVIIQHYVQPEPTRRWVRQKQVSLQWQHLK